MNEFLLVVFVALGMMGILAYLGKLLSKGVE